MKTLSIIMVAFADALSYETMFSCISTVMNNFASNQYPVCGTDHVTYRHKFELDYYNCQHPGEEVNVLHRGQCEYSFFGNTIANEECTFCNHMLPPKFAVCGSDLRFYKSLVI